MEPGFWLPKERAWLADRLPGRHNDLWCKGEDCLTGNGPPTWTSDLERWLKDIRPSTLWADYEPGPDVARHLATAMGRVILAAAFLKVDRPNSFREHLASACESYADALGCPAPFPAIPEQQLTAWGHATLLDTRLGLIDKYLKAAANNFPAAALGMVRSALSDLVEAGAGTRVLLGPLQHCVRLPVTFVLVGLGGSVGHAATLTIEWFAGSGQKPVLVCSPADLGCTVLNRDFCRAVGDAWTVAGRVAQPQFQGGAFIRWGLDVSPGRDALAIAGNSAGGAMAVALVALAERRRLDRVAVMACLKAGQGTDSVSIVSEDFDKVDGVPKKARAAYDHLDVRRVVLWRLDESIPDDNLRELIQEENPGLVVERLGGVRRAVDRLSGRLTEVVAFLRSYACKGLASSLVFRPQTWDNAELLDFRKPAQFCQPTQVITEKEWDALRKHAAQRERGRRGAEERDYVLLTYLTYELGLRGEERPRDLERELNNASQPHVLLRGEPGEGKTTALWTHVAQRCLDLAQRIEAGEVAVDAPRVRVPLALPLNNLADADLDGSLVQAARRTVVKTAASGHCKPLSPLVAEWLDSRIERADAPGYELCLDALDELESKAGPATSVVG